MSYSLRTFQCPDCPTRHTRRAPAKSVQRCHPCNVKYAAEHNRQMHAKDGPAYVRWVWASATYYRRLSAQITEEYNRRVA